MRVVISNVRRAWLAALRADRQWRNRHRAEKLSPVHHPAS